MDKDLKNLEKDFVVQNNFMPFFYGLIIGVIVTLISGTIISSINKKNVTIAKQKNIVTVEQDKNSTTTRAQQNPIAEFEFYQILNKDLQQVPRRLQKKEGIRYNKEKIEIFSHHFFLQIGSFQHQRVALATQRKLEQLNLKTRIQPIETGGGNFVFRLLAGPYNNLAEVAPIETILKKESISYYLLRISQERMEPIPQ